ncbi:DUF4350 domain-containing protein [Austwickia chelonae]|uniref:DUF4350 domain-containing protein n=1 Tax=Austwickia chelonae TaxID=100225 RepID=UPI000E2642F2|nr:DUF4350 domain-containing protein [Austwickia chelonae]
MNPIGRLLGTVGVLLALVAAALLGTYWVAGDRIGSEPGNLDSTTSNGGAALAVLLRERAQVDVRMARTSSDLGNPAEGTFVIAAPGKIPDQALGSVRSHAARAKTLVLVNPHRETLEMFARDISVQEKIQGSFGARCTAEGIRAGDEITGETRLYRSSRSLDKVCFTQVGGGAGMPGAVVIRDDLGRRIVVVGSLDIFTNQHLRLQGNAAVALRLTGSHPHVTWYSGAPESKVAEKKADAGSAWQPKWFQPLVLGLAATVVVAMFWRGRRLGRLSREPLPVVVQAGETTLARGRMYRRARQPSYAATILQQATCRRLSMTLDLPPSADPSVVAQAASQVCGRSPHDILHTLTCAPQNDADLAALAGALASLEGEVRRT